jgi:hypothetical protein
MATWRVIEEPIHIHGENGTAVSSSVRASTAHRPQTKPDDLERKLAAASKLAILCCLEISRVLSQTEIWALEDYSEEFQGLRLPVRCAVACGGLNDVHVGVDGVRLGHVVTGQAVRDTMMLMKKGPGSDGCMYENLAYLSPKILC